MFCYFKRKAYNKIAENLALKKFNKYKVLFTFATFESYSDCHPRATLWIPLLCVKDLVCFSTHRVAAEKPNFPVS